MATDSVERLRNRTGGGTIQVEVSTDGYADAEAVRRRLEQVPGVSKVLDRALTEEKLTFEVDSLPGHNARPEIARAVVQSGWGLLELKSLTFSLEEVFLELTGATPETSVVAPTTEIVQ